MITVRHLSALALPFAAVCAPAFAQYAPSPKEAVVLEALGYQERQVFTEDGISMLGGFLDVVHTTAPAAARLYGENEVAGDKRLYRKNVLLSGTIAAINSGLGNAPYVVFAAPSALQVHAHLVKRSTDRASTLRKGQRLTLFCQGAGALAGSPVFRSCLFVDDAAEEKWSELTKQIQAYYNGARVQRTVVQHLAIAVSAIAMGLPAKSCNAADKDCRAAVSKVMHGDQFNSLMSQAIDRFKVAGLAVPAP